MPTVAIRTRSVVDPPEAQPTVSGGLRERAEVQTPDLAGRVRELEGKVRDSRQAQVDLVAAEERIRRQTAELLHGAVQTRLLVAVHRLRKGLAVLDSDPARARALVEEICTEIDQVREQEVRQASHMLHPSVIGVGLLPAIFTLAKRFDGVFETVVHSSDSVRLLDSPVDNQFPEALRLGVYRIIEEAFGNAYKHARARRVTVRLTEADRTLHVSVEDDGLGCDPRRMKRGLGLKVIAARIDQLNGIGRLFATPGEGMRLDLWFPFDPLPAGAE